MTDGEHLALVAMIIAPNELNVAASPDKNRERVSRIKRFINGECRPANVSNVYYEECAR